MRHAAYKLMRYLPRRRRVTLGVRALVRNAAGDVLLVRHTYLKGWYLPGGTVDPGETLGQAVARELMEECGIRSLEQRLIGVYFNRAHAASDHVALFEVKRWDTDPAGVVDGEIAEAGFFQPGHLPAGTSPATRRRVQELVAGCAAPEYW